MGGMKGARFLVLSVLVLAACGAAPGTAAVRPATISPSPEASPSPATRPASRVLAVPWHHQAHALSCEAAALKMALEYEGITLDELTLIGYMGRDSRPARFDAQGRLVAWGDPNQSYVGNPDGKMGVSGYGVYFAPVANAAVMAGTHVVAAGSGLYGSAIPPADVYDAILDGHPVVVWISNRYRQVGLAAYTAYDGATVKYTLTEHAVTVIGVRPGAVLINDPWFGQGWHTKAQFESAYATFAQMAVIVG